MKVYMVIVTSEKDGAVLMVALYNNPHDAKKRYENEMDAWDENRNIEYIEREFVPLPSWKERK